MTTAYLRTRHELLFDQLVSSFTSRHTTGITRSAIKLQVIDLRLLAAQLRARGCCPDCDKLTGRERYGWT